jgi:hypothetical protein
MGIRYLVQQYNRRRITNTGGETMALDALSDEPFEVVSCYDPALTERDNQEISQYGITRDLSSLAIDTLKVKPSIFKLLPLKKSHQQFITEIGINPDITWHVFQEHCFGVENFVARNGGKAVELKAHKSRGMIVKDSCRKNIPLTVLNEMVLIVSEVTARGPLGVTAYTPPADCSRYWIRRRLQAAIKSEAVQKDSETMTE